MEDPAAIEYIAGSSYSNLIENLSYDLSEFEPCSAFIITLDEEGNGRVILDLPNYEVDDTRALGDSFKYDMSDHPNLQNALLSHYSGLTFEKTDDFIRSGTYYVVYEPVLVHGKVLCIRGLACKWVEIFVGIIVPFIAATIIGVIGISLMFLVLFLLIYFRVISPIGKIQKNLRKYIFNKNSGDVLSAMKKIKARNEIGRLSDDVVDLAMEMDKYTNDIVRMTGESQRVATELDMAKNIQAGQLPSVFPPFPDRDEFDIYASMTPAKEVGGDFYDFFLIDDDHLALVMADVSGKGVPAALFMMMSKMLIHNYATMGLTPHEVVEKTNDTICENNPEKMFVTVWFG
ncbi:MAG: SpoIIE family protein phosphatase, partial [Bacteroidales bacterium]|nr:SpoIIE family protein phosphatase [Bacteroidales bacterium]